MRVFSCLIVSVKTRISEICIWERIQSREQRRAVADVLVGHRRLLEQEVAASRRDLERLLAGLPVRALAWREGTSLGASARADEALTNAGYGLLFANHAVQGVV